MEVAPCVTAVLKFFHFLRLYNRLISEFIEQSGSFRCNLMLLLVYSPTAFFSTPADYNAHNPEIIKKSNDEVTVYNVLLLGMIICFPELSKSRPPEEG
jgi:hypothetical protein